MATPLAALPSPLPASVGAGAADANRRLCLALLQFGGNGPPDEMIGARKATAPVASNGGAVLGPPVRPSFAALIRPLGAHVRHCNVATETTTASIRQPSTKATVAERTRIDHQFEAAMDTTRPPVDHRPSAVDQRSAALQRCHFDRLIYAIDANIATLTADLKREPKK